MASHVVTHALLAELWMTLHPGSEARIDALGRLTTIFTPCVAAAVARGACRSDLTVADVLLLIWMLGGSLIARTPATQHALSQRAWQLVVETAALKGAPLTVGAPSAPA